jgi:hypothetical protein
VSTYTSFLETKRSRAIAAGPTVDRDDINPMLFDWQAAVVEWAVRTGRPAIFADCGLGKSFMQIEWARLSGERSLILAPLSVARQTVREAAKLGIDASYVRHSDQAVGPGVYVTNYEMASRFDADTFDAVVLDESSLLKNVDGRTRQLLTKQWAGTDQRLACTATPAPNDIAELCNHAEFLGHMGRAEMLAFFFVNDEFHGRSRWRLKGHAGDGFYQWMATWATALRRPSDLGWSDAGYDLPALNIYPEVVAAEIAPPDGKLFAELGGVTGRAQARRSSLAARVERAAKLATGTDDQWIVWCGLNDEATALTDAIPGAVNVEGSWVPDRKAEALESFQDCDIRVLVTKPSIAGFGMNFQNAHRMVFVGLSDSFESYYQAIRRCWRFGQTHPVDVHIVVSELEQEIVANVRAKEREASSFATGLAAHSQVRSTS